MWGGTRSRNRVSTAQPVIKDGKGEKPTLEVPPEASPLRAHFSGKQANGREHKRTEERTRELKNKHLLIPEGLAFFWKKFKRPLLYH
jgi:hypothetical protein